MTEYEMKVKRHEQLNRYVLRGETVFAGSSLMEQFPIGEMAQTLPGRPIVYNRGIGGDTLAGFACRLDSAVLDLAPRRLVMSYYPVNRTSLFDTAWLGARTNAEIARANARLAKLAADLGIIYADVSSCLTDAAGNLRADLTVDGVHMHPDAYALVLDVIAVFVMKRFNM